MMHTVNVLEHEASAISLAEVLGVGVSCLSMDETVAEIERLILAGRAGAAPQIIATADASGIVMAQRDAELLAIYQGAALVTADSYGVVWALRKAGRRVERVSGVDIAERLCALSAIKGYGIYLLGAEPGVAEAAAERLALKHPGIKIVGAHHGYFPASEDDFVAAEVARAEPDILLVAMGIPRQEKFIVKTMPVIRAKVSLGVGGTLDVFSGRVRRAPVLIQRLKLEWLWRTLSNPKRIGKAKLLPQFAWMVLTGRRPR